MKEQGILQPVALYAPGELVQPNTAMKYGNLVFAQEWVNHAVLCLNPPGSPPVAGEFSENTLDATSCAEGYLCAARTMM